MSYDRLALARLDYLMIQLEALNLADIVDCPVELVRELVQFQCDYGIAGPGCAKWGLPAPVVPRSCTGAHSLVMDLQEYFMADPIPEAEADGPRNHHAAGRPAA